MVDALPLTEAAAGAIAAAVALGLTEIQPREIRQPILGATTVAMSTAWGLDLAPGRLLVAVVAGFVLAFSSEGALRHLGVFVAASSLATVLPPAFSNAERLAIAAAVLVGAIMVPRIRTYDRLWALLILGSTSFGGFLAAPDTERIAFFGAMVAVIWVWAVGLKRKAALSSGALVVLTALVVWAGAVDARGRSASLVATVVPLALLVVIAGLDRADRRPRRYVLVPTVVALVAFVGRVAGLRSDVSVAWVLGWGAFAVAATVVIVTSRPAGHVIAEADGHRWRG